MRHEKKYPEIFEYLGCRITSYNVCYTKLLRVQMGFAGYFLIVADFINWAKRNGVPVGPGRGSGAGSLVAYALGITDRNNFV